MFIIVEPKSWDIFANTNWLNLLVVAFKVKWWNSYKQVLVDTDLILR